MTDMLVRLYDLPGDDAPVAPGVVVQRPLAADSHHVLAFVERHFAASAPGWVDECRCALAARPPTCFVAAEAGAVIGFACFDATARGLFGPVGVAPDARGRGVGRALLLACLRQMAADGYAYAVIGWAHSEAFYRRAVGAEPIAGSEPGLYAGRLRG
ncbi:MAG: GNAT family N-acetyltransferase [Rhodocyclaceae bacterium]|nr:GNAT family N-acetyltransferase [Rhodocyclaceae bacterium]